MAKEFTSFSAFYPFYLSEHSNRISRRLHFIGTLGVLVIVFKAVFWRDPVLLWLVPVVGYGFAWIGHFFFEKNRPATFQYPIYSLMGDFAMFRDILIGRIRF